MRNRKLSNSLWFATLGLLMLTLSGCGLFGGGGDDGNSESGSADTNVVLGSEQPLTGQANLVCNQACLDRAQCGFLENEERVVLMNSQAPDVQNHDLLTASGTPANILGTQEALVANVATGQQTTWLYYQVQVPELPPGWAAGWCLEQPR